MAGRLTGSAEGTPVDESSRFPYNQGQTLEFGRWPKRSLCRFTLWGERDLSRAADTHCEPPPPNPPRKAALRGRFAVQRRKGGKSRSTGQRAQSRKLVQANPH